MAQQNGKNDLTETSRLESPAGGEPVAGGTSDPAGSKGDPSSRTKYPNNIDTFIGRLVVDQGLATPEEVQMCLEQARNTGAEDVVPVPLPQAQSQLSLAELLVNNEYITRRQAERLKVMAEAERSGQQIPGYKLLGKLGAGAMATVYKGRQLSLDRMVAIKVLPRKLSQSTQFIERFYQEGRAAAQLNHPNIVQAYDVGKAGDYHFFVMEYVDGRTVYDDIVKHKRYSENEAIDIAIQITGALQHAHERGLIHRDVKPKNIMITKEGIAKLADMGLARAISDKEAAEAEQGKAFGTPYYISPEQIRGEVNITPAADIYSLGATLYHMLTGNVPFDGKSPTDVMHKHLREQLVPPDQVNRRLSSGIAEVIEMMMAKDFRKRHQTCKDLLVDLKAVREGKAPPIAHKDIGGDLDALSKAEAAAPSMMAEDTSASGHGRTVSMPLFIVMCVLLVVSVLVNVLLFSRG
jgi:eukaryotic-like serine/threonine-protein kinase